MLNQKSVLARLLANENITVQQGNFETAFFDVKSRVLGLPMWKDMGRDIYDMLVGHEVAHALYTPQDFNQYMNEGIPHSWLNIVEDVRIEKLMLRKYPGLVANFKRGYFDLMMNKNIFGIKDADISSMNFMDRLNVAAKARDLIEVPFTDEELVYVNQAKACETYEDVVQCCRDIQAWLGTKGDDQNPETPEMMDPNAENQQQDGEPSEMTGQSSDSDADGEEGDDQDNGQTSETDGEGEESDSSESGDGEESDQDGEDTQSGDGEESGQDGSEGEEGEGENDADESTPGTMRDLPSGDANGEAVTDVNYRNNQSELIEDRNEIVLVKGLTRQQLKSIVVPHAEVAQGRLDRIATLIKNYREYGYSVKPFPEADYAKFLADTKRVVNLMVKEFEMRKAAYRSARARTSTRGSLDVNKLHSYKYDDQLFKQVAQLADAKNHGMMMLVDYSGSMHPIMPSVIRQLLALTMFCKRVGIPFEVYSFTSMSSSAWDSRHRELASQMDTSFTRFDNERLGMLELFSSKMSKREYEEASKMMFWQSVSSYNTYGSSDLEDLGNTPLNSALQACSYLIDDFRKKYAVDKMNFITLTDGDSNSAYIRYGDDLASRDRWARPKKFAVEYNGQIVEINNYGGWKEGRQTTAAFVKAIAKKGVKTINYFVAARNSDLSNELKRVHDWDMEKVNTDRKQIRANGVCVSDGVYGYDRRFVLMGETSELRGEIDDLEVNSEMTAAKIAKAFSKNSGSKKKSRIVTQKFAELIA